VKQTTWIHDRPTSPGAARAPELDLFDRELARLLEAFSEDPSDDGTFGRLEALLRGCGRWEIVPDRSSEPAPSSKRA